MRKNFLLLLWLTLLPLAGWAQTASWTSGSAPDDLVYGDAVPSIPSLVTVVSSYGDHNCTSAGEGTSAPTGNTNQYRWKLSKNGSNVDGSAPLEVGTYTLTLYIRHQTGGGWPGTYGNGTRTLTFSVAKKEVTVSLYQVVAEWRNPMQYPIVAGLDASAYSVSGATWNDVKDYLKWKQVEAVTNVGSYKYTFETTADHPNYIIHFATSEAYLKVEKNTTAYWEEYATDGPTLTYIKGEEQALAPTDVPVLWDTDGNVAGTIEYSLDGVNWSADYPKATDAGSYVIEYRAVGDDNHDVSAVANNTYNVTIDKADAEIVATLDPTSYTYAPDLATTLAPGFTSNNDETGGDVVYWYSYNGGFFAPSSFDGAVGDWQVIAVQAETANFNETQSAPVDFTVTPATIEETWLTWTNSSTYDATDQLGTIEAGIEILNGTTPLVLGTDFTIAIAKDGSAVTDVTNAGTYTYTFTGVGNYDGQFSVEFTMNKATWPTVVDPVLAAGWTYDADNHALIAAPADITGYGTDVLDANEVVYYLDDVETALTALEVKNANPTTGYKVSYSVNETDNYLGIAKADVGFVKVAKAGLDIAAQSVTVEWTGTAIAAGELVKVDDTDIPALETATPEELAAALAGFKAGAFVEVKEGGAEEAVTPIPSDAGAYKFELEAQEHENYEINDFVPNGTLTITKKNAVAAIVTPATPIYDGTDQELVTVDDSGMEGVESMLYFLDEEGAGAPPAGDARWTADIPTGKDADDYVVWYMAKGDKNHNDVAAAEADVTIAQKALDIAMFVFDPATLTAEYDGSDLTPAFTIATGEPMVEADYELAKTNSAGEDVTEMKAVDTYTFTFTGAADGNYTGTVSADFTITPKALADEMFTLSENVTYTGAAQKPTISTGDEPIVEADYTIEVKDSEGNVVAIDALVDADTYTFNFIAAAGGNYSGSASAEWTIGQKELDIAMFTLSSYEEVYDGTNLMPTFTAADGEPSALVDADYTVATTNSKPEAVTEMIDADTYTFTFTAAADGNYTGEVSADFVIKQDAAEFVVAEANNLTYNGKDQALVTEAETDAVDGVVEYQVLQGEEVLVDWTEDYSAIVQRNAGEYTVKTKFTASEINYTNPEVNEEVTVTINKATIGYNLGNLTKTWDGELFSDEEIAKLFTLYAGGEGGMLFDGDEYDKPFTLTLPEDYRDAGTYKFKQPTVEFKEGYPVNYNVNFAGEAEIIINKADITEADFDAPAAIAGLTYDFGNEMDLVTAGSVTTTYQYPEMEEAEKIGTILFADAEDGEYGEDPLKGAAAGEYEVWYKVAGDKNHNDTKPVKITNTIATYELTDAFLPETYETELPYKAAAYEATDFIPALDGIELDEGYEVFAPEMINAGEYELLYKGINNMGGEFTVTVKVTPIDVIATAPKGVTKVYDGTASLENAKIGEKALSNEDISFSGLISPDKIELPTELAMTTEGIKAGAKYAITVDPSLFAAANPNYNILSETIEGEVEITKAPAIKVGFDAVPTWTKEFGEEDPELTGYTVKVTDGEFFDNIDDVLAATTAVRAEGEDVDTYDVTLTIDATAEVFANYEGVAFDETAATFEITKSSKTYTVSLANIEETYTGEAFATAIEFDADDLVIAGYTGDKAKFFTTMPTATLAEGAKTVGDYNITLTEGESQNFKFTFVPATFTIKPFEVTEATIESQKVQKGKELDVTKFTITAPAADAEKFYVTAPDLVDLDDIVTGDAGVYPEGLVIAVDASVADNYTGLDAFTAELEIISAEAVVLADNEDCKPEAQEGVDVTFASRKINAGNWNVVALPFAATVTQISDAFGYAAVDVLTEENANAKEIHFHIISSGTIPAYTPFIVKTTEDDGYKKTDFDQVVFHNVNIEAGDGENKSVQDIAGNKFWGTFQAETKIWGEKFRYMSKGAWYDAKNYTESSPAKIGAFRGYIEMVEAGARIFIEEPDGTVTAIDAVEFNKQAAEGMYNLNGVKVNNLNRKGVYIKNGVKVIK